MYKKKGYCDILVLIYMLFLHIFVHTGECDRNTQVCVETVINFLHVGMSTLGIYPEDIYPKHLFFQWLWSTKMKRIYQRLLKK